MKDVISVDNDKWYILTIKKKNNTNLDVHVHHMVHFILFRYIWYIKLHKWCIPVKMTAQMVHVSYDDCTNGAFQLW